MFEQVNWQITGPSGGVKTTSGTVNFLADEFRKNIVVEITSDDVPELEAEYNLTIMSVDGGADLDLAHDNVSFKIRLVKSWPRSRVLFLVVGKMVLVSQSVNEILNYDDSNESCTVCYAQKDNANVSVWEDILT